MPNEFDFLSSLTKGVRSAFSMLQSLAHTEKSTTQILKEAREAGYSFRTQQALDVIGVLRGNIDAARSIRVTPPDVPLDPRTYGKALTNTLRNFSYQVLVRGVDPLNKETVNRDITISSNIALSRNDIVRMASGYVGKRGSRGELEIDDIEVTDALTSADFGE